jgi:hypothetical protein
VYSDRGIGDIYLLDDGKPVINAITPATGVPAGGTDVTIYGQNLGSSPAVTFDGVGATSSLSSATELHAISPSHSAGSVNVIVTNGVDASAPKRFLYGPAAPANFTATATSTSSVMTSWSSVSGATSYDVQRQQSNFTWASIGTTSALFLNDGTPLANKTYVYRVIASDGSANTSLPSEPDFATTVELGGASVQPGLPIQAAPIANLQTVVNAMLTTAGLQTVSFVFVTGGTTVAAQHVTQLRSPLSSARSVLLGGAPKVTFTDSSLTGVVVKAVHVQELIDAVK